MVVFQSNNELIVHRIVDINEDMITTRGDANNTDDEPIHVSSIKGKVVGIVENIGWFIDFLRSPIVVITVLVCAILLMEFSFKKEKQEKNDKISKIKEEIRQLKG
jgi:signal peptidase